MSLAKDENDTLMQDEDTGINHQFSVSSISSSDNSNIHSNKFLTVDTQKSNNDSVSSGFGSVITDASSFSISAKGTESEPPTQTCSNLDSRPAVTGIEEEKNVGACPVLSVPTKSCSNASIASKPSRKTCKFKKKNNRNKPMKLDLLKGSDPAYFTLESQDGMTSSPCQKNINVQFQVGQEILEENSETPSKTDDHINSPNLTDSVTNSNSTTSSHSSSCDSADSGISSGSNSSSPDTSPNNNTVQPKSVNSCQKRSTGNSRNLLAGMPNQMGMLVPGMNASALAGMTMHSSLKINRASRSQNSKTQTSMTQVSHSQMQYRSANGLTLFSQSQTTLRSYQTINCQNDNKMSAIIPGKLYVGSLENLNDIEDFEKHHITRVVTAMNDFPESMHNLPSIQKCKQDNLENCANPENGHLIVSVRDRGHENIDKYFDQVNAFIDGNQTGATYIHCHSGISRSVTLCMAYLLARNFEKIKTVPEAIKYMQEKRPKSYPNFGFLGQLAVYNKSKESSTDSGFSEDVEM